MTRILIEFKVLWAKAPFSALKSWKTVICAVQSYRLQLVILYLATHSGVEYLLEEVAVPPDFSSG